MADFLTQIIDKAYIVNLFVAHLLPPSYIRCNMHITTQTKC